MDRRTVVVRLGALFLIVPASRVLFGCGGTSNETDGGTTGGTTGGPTDAGGGVDAGFDAGTAVDAGTGTPLVFTSSLVNGHTHTFTLQSNDITTPPSVGVTGPTSVAQGHSHTVTLTNADLSDIAAGATITKETSMVVGHTHTFQFKKS